MLFAKGPQKHNKCKTICVVHECITCPSSGNSLADKASPTAAAAETDVDLRCQYNNIS